MRRRKSSLLTSAYIAALIIGPISPAMLASCAPNPEPVAKPAIFFGLEDCKKVYGDSACATAFAKARENFANSTPQFSGKTAKAQCEAQYGTGNCETRGSSSGGGGDVFVPLLTGYMLGNMLADSRRYDSGYYDRYVGDYRRYEREERERRRTYGSSYAYVPYSGGTSGTYSRQTTYSSPARSMASSAATSSGSTRAYSGTTMRGGFGATGAARGGFGG